ncbi:hypothetical protein [Arthrobacter dokdonensis]|nr:hypothetical protein [Arthrobacter dokdonellae]
MLAAEPHGRQQSLDRARLAAAPGWPPRPAGRRARLAAAAGAAASPVP